MPTGANTRPGASVKLTRCGKRSRPGSGCRVQLIADTRYEIPAGVKLREASRSEVVCLRDSMLPQLFERTPDLTERCQQFTADRGLECAQLKATLYDHYDIVPLIDCKMMR